MTPILPRAQLWRAPRAASVGLRLGGFLFEYTREGLNRMTAWRLVMLKRMAALPGKSTGMKSWERGSSCDGEPAECNASLPSSPAPHSNCPPESATAGGRKVPRGAGFTPRLYGGFLF